jgi:predicted enzyme related to lactoylglutathione lyase
MAGKKVSVGDIGQVAVTVSDVASARQFYGEVLGLRFLFDAGPNLAFLAAGPVRIMLATPQGAGAVGQNSILYFRVHDVESAYQSLCERGATADSKPALVAKMSDHDLWLAFVRDPDGNLVGQMEERRQ